MFNVLDHELVPKHEILHKDEKKAVLEKFGIPKDRLPFIMESDPVIKAIKAKAGDVIKISRKSPTAGDSVYYRVVVKG